MQIVVKSLTVLKGHLGGMYGHLVQKNSIKGQSLKIGGNVDSMTYCQHFATGQTCIFMEQNREHF